MSTILRPDDINPGMLATVLSAPLIECVNAYGATHQMRDERMTGIPVKVLAVNLPYFTAEILSGQAAGARLIFDVRTHQFCRVSREYAESLAPRPQGYSAPEVNGCSTPMEAGGDGHVQDLPDRSSEPKSG